MTFKFELATQDDARVLTDFHNSAYGTKRSPDFWSWEYFGRRPDRAVVVKATHDGKLIASQGMIPIELDYEGRIFVTAKSEGTLLDPAYRGSGLFADLYEFAIQHCQSRGISSIWGFTPKGRAFERFGFDVVDSACYASRGIAASSRDLRASFRLNHLGRGFQTDACHEIGGLVALVKRPNGLGMKRLSFSSFCEVVLGTSRKQDSDVELYRTEEFLKWRWKDNPVGRTYFASTADDTAWIVLRRHLGRTYLGDYGGESKEAVQQLVAAYVGRYVIRSVSVGSFINTLHPEGALLASVDNLFSRQVLTNFVYRQLDDGVQKPKDSSFRFTYAWSEGYGT